MMRTWTGRIIVTLVVTSIVCLLAGCRPGGAVEPATEQATEMVAETAASTDAAKEEPSPTVAPQPTLSTEADEGDAPDESRPVSPCDNRRGDLFRSGLIGSEQALVDGLSGASVYEIDLEISQDLQSVSYTHLTLPTN